MEIDFKKYENGLVPAIIQDSRTKNVLMLGFMNNEAYEKTIATNKVTFFSRSKQRLWTKGEETKNYLLLDNIKNDCDNDALLIQVTPQGPTCHKGTDTCWGESNKSNFSFLTQLEEIIEDRWNNKDNADSYIASLFNSGINKVAQKVGEEAVEVVIEAKDDNDHLFLNESADLLFHIMVLLQAKGFHLRDVEKTLISRHK
ncbi:bifunctional phosphoribosyl-AMP cyclohydrolase/phosphoribosyl-ATP diphosphatase HisIE [uncultured Dokdonia sp.]|jgi:phosphoribosyl-ATP pyrophosphohydrolase/phosphoribosyl-AMP cyclohydrolase|uniref:bifunctional phosphoribosyl-AMP cyclohydrolase/phosphoribosyl-ATP diphosphatase HisIE n=1 Tax=unclassified Dokdonia TaxID=2615033 RepID=UPI00263241A1|nr:bifunctional phosphoribosyl-AMP cyclohydrolase/phosphoribosyl-ATP diphosphatase HisIE [uncultured Dokdonia sp.]|tara:strand:- start:71487 stop:72086 length:600 start_codon:yes stop_codon:yes gene_type:complete